MRLSVIIPVYGVERFIGRCARSLLSQYTPETEYIFVDDGSPDRSAEVLRGVIAEYASARVRVVTHAQNSGLAAARLTGIEAAEGEYIMHVDGDDYLEPDALALILRTAEQTQADIIRINAWYEWAHTRKAYEGPFDSDPQAYSRLLLSGATLPASWLHVIRRELYTRTGVHPTPGVNLGEDYGVTPRLSWYARSIAQVEKPVYHYLQYDAPSFAKRTDEAYIRQLVQTMEDLTAFFADETACFDALRAGQWQKKTDLYLRADKRYYALVQTMPASLPPVTTTMSVGQRIAARLIARERWDALWRYSCLYRRAIRLYQVMKRRSAAC